MSKSDEGDGRPPAVTIATEGAALAVRAHEPMMIERETRDMLVMRPSTRAEREAERAAFIQAEKERRQETSRAQRLARRAARRAQP